MATSCPVSCAGKLSSLGYIYSPPDYPRCPASASAAAEAEAFAAAAAAAEPEDDFEEVDDPMSWATIVSRFGVPLNLALAGRWVGS